MPGKRINRAWVVVRRLSLKRLSFGVLTLLLVLAVADVALNVVFRDMRVAWVGELFRESMDGSQPAWELKPGARIEYRGAGDEQLAVSVIQINSLGLRERERDAAKPPGAFRVICMGDSHTMGLGVELDEALPARLEQEFGRAGHPEVEVWNAGVASYNMYDYLPYLRKRILPLQPDLIVFQVCGNDAQRIPLLEAGHLGLVLRLVRYSGLAKLIVALASVREDTFTFLTRFYQIIETCEQAGVPLVIWPQSWPEQGGEPEAVDYCIRHNVTILNLDEFRPVYLPKDPHYTAQSYQELAQVMLPQLLPYLELAAGSDQGAP